MSVYLSKEEYEALYSAARSSGASTSTWARDVLLSRALVLYRHRHLIDPGAE
jgi:hypothetical protein